MTKAASGLHYGARADVEHITLATKQAMAKLDCNSVASVLLFLTPGYAYAPQDAIREAAKCAGTLQVFGCCSMGLISDREWLIDGEGAAVMVFSTGVGLFSASVLAQQGLTSPTVLSLVSPNAVNMALNPAFASQFGAVIADEYGHGPFSVWQSGRIVEQEHCHLGFSANQKIHLLRADSVTAVSAPLQLNKAREFTLEQIELEPALTNLNRYRGQTGELLCAVSASNAPDVIQNGDYELYHVVGGDPSLGTVTLSGSVRAGRYLMWARRDPAATQRSLEHTLTEFRQSHCEPHFALMFSNISRGAEFFGGRDRDFDLFKQAFPSTPLVGFYSNAEIAPVARDKHSVCHHHSALFALGV